EYGKWCYAFRRRAEDMLRQVRLWLAESYETQGKFWQAGEQYRAMVLADPSDEETLQRWLEMLARHGKRQEALKCYQDMKEFMETQGYLPSHELEQAVLSLNKQSCKVLLAPSQTTQIVYPSSIEQSSPDLFVLTDSDVSGRLAALLTKSSIIGATEVVYFDQRTRFYWRAREETTLSVATLYSSVVKYMSDLTTAFACSYLPTFRQQLCEIISRTVLLAGVLLYDMGQYAKARENYQIAFQAANEAGNAVLQAIIWGWASFTWTYSQHYQKALHCIQYARHLVSPISDICVQVWLAAIEAEIQSHSLNRGACKQWLNTLDHSLDVLPSPDTAYLFEFNSVLLLGYKGICLQRLYQKQEPETHSFLREAKEALERALASEAPLKRKLYYLSDLASVYARQGEVEKACAYVAQSLPTVLQIGGGSKTIHQHLFQVRTLLQPYKGSASVQALDEQLNLLYLRE
ncbi:MAG: bacterial transcriptional activator domain-containing protein, partial [Ktedonobacteraceae bacterium]